MTYTYGKYRFVLEAGGAVRVYRGEVGPVIFYPGSVVTYSDLMIWAHGFMAGKDNEGWGGML